MDGWAILRKILRIVCTGWEWLMRLPLALLGLLLFSGLIAVLLNCTAEVSTPRLMPTSTTTPLVSTPTPFPTSKPLPTWTPYPTSKPLPTSTPTPPTPPTPTPVPTVTPVPTPTPAVPCESKQCGYGSLGIGGVNETMDVAKDLWTDITVGERQLAGFIAQCEISGVGASGSARDGDRTGWYKVQRKYLPDKPLGDVIETGWDPWGPVWQEREWWWKEEEISIDGPGAYR